MNGKSPPVPGPELTRQFDHKGIESPFQGNLSYVVLIPFPWIKKYSNRVKPSISLQDFDQIRWISFCIKFLNPLNEPQTLNSWKNQNPSTRFNLWNRNRYLFIHRIQVQNAVSPLTLINQVPYQEEWRVIRKSQKMNQKQRSLSQKDQKWVKILIVFFSHPPFFIFSLKNISDSWINWMRIVLRRALYIYNVHRQETLCRCNRRINCHRNKQKLRKKRYWTEKRSEKEQN